MKPRLRRVLRVLLLASAVLLGLVVVLVGVVHTASFQHWAWTRAAAAIEQETGWHVDVEQLRLRLLPASLRAANITASSLGEQVAAIELLEARWDWSGLLADTPRVEYVLVDGLVVDTAKLPPAPETPDAEPAADPWHVVEIGELRLRRATARAEAGPLELALSELDAAASLEGGRAALQCTAEGLGLARDHRALELGPLRLRASGSSAGLEVEQLALEGRHAGLDLAGSVSGLDSDLTGELRFDLRGELHPLLGWWDPQLAQQLETSGMLRLAGTARLEADGSVTADLSHDGDPIQVAGYELEHVEVHSAAGITTLRIAGARWGEATARLALDDPVRVALTLHDAPLGPAMALAPVELPPRLRGPLRLAGNVSATFTLPIAMETVEADADLGLTAPDGTLALRGELRQGVVAVEQLDLNVQGAALTASGRFDLDQELAADARLAINNTDQVQRLVRRWMPEMPALELGGGPVAVSAHVAGPPGNPRFDAGLQWTGPQAYGVVLDELAATARGSLRRLDWTLSARAATTSLTAAGTAVPGEPAVTGTYTFSAAELGQAVALAPVQMGVPLSGSIEADGRFAWNLKTWTAQAQLLGVGLSSPPWSVDSVQADLVVDPLRAELTALHVTSCGAVLEGSASVALADLDAPLEAQLQWHGLDLARLPLELPPATLGVVAGTLRLDGSMSRPAGEATLAWTGSESSMLSSLVMQAVLADGQLHAVSEEMETAAGPLVLSATVPLGDVPRPQWLWPDAPGGEIIAAVQGQSLPSGPVFAAAGIDDPPADIVTDLRLDVRWDLADTESRLVDLELSNLVIHAQGEELVAQRPLAVTVRGQQVSLEPVELVGKRTRFNVAGSYDLGRNQVEARISSRLAPELARMLPLPLQVIGPFNLDAEVSGPLDDLSGMFLFQHHGGQLVMRDPPLEITDLKLAGTYEDGVLTIDEGSAGMNRGTLLIGGGWDPEVGQGVVLELENVNFMLPMGILSRWNGNLVIEPQAGRLARVAGDMELLGGLWDQPFSIADALFAETAAGIAPDDPLFDISLDLEVRGLSGIHVDNNLGEFDVGWNVLQIGGTAALPVLAGELRLAAGGQITLSGRTMTIRRGVIEFTGEPGAEPRVDIVPQESISVYRTAKKDDEQEGFDASLFAMKGIAHGLGSALGLENKTLRAAEISVETETDPATRFSIGQRLSRFAALFITTDLTNVQDREALLQLWNFNRLRGLAIQAFNEATGDYGYGLIERLRWGGTTGSDDRPRVYRIRFEGDWPVSKRKMRKAAGLFREMPYDPFMLFASSVRMERELASRGFFEARVTARATGKPNLPTLVFTCESGPRLEVLFTGDRVTRELRHQITAIYQPPPLEEPGLANMGSMLERELAARGFPEARVEVSRGDDGVVVAVERGREITLEGPEITGLDAEQVGPLRLALGNPSALAVLRNDPERATARIRQLLQADGYPDAEITGIRVEPVDEETERLHVDVEPGRRAIIAEVRLEGNDPLGVTGREGFPVYEGAALDRTEIDRAVRIVRRAYREAGHAEVAVSTELEAITDNRWRLAFEVLPGPQRTVTEVRFTGNRHVSDSVLRKGVQLEPGDLLRTSDLDRSVVTLAGFAPLERVDVSSTPEGSDGAVVEVAVTERPRWTVGLGTRWTSIRGIEALMDLRDDNLLGRGLSLNLRGRWASEDRYAALIVSLPPLPGGRLSALASFTYSDDQSKIDPERLREEWQTAALEASYRLPRSSQVRLYAKYSTVFTYEKVPNPFFPIETELTINTLGTQYIRDLFDDPFDPSSGYYLAADLSWSSSAIGSDLANLRSLLTASVASQPRRGWTWSQSLRLGIAEALEGQQLDPEVRFYAGGEASIRGFERDAVGPTFVGFDGVPVPDGGGALLILNEELRIPLWRQLRLAVFADIGQVWTSWNQVDANLAVGAGVGLRFDTPIGPLWADVAWPVANRGISESAQFYIGIGRPF